MGAFANYRATLTVPGARSFFLTTVLGRLAVSTYALGVVLMASAFYPSYLQAGLIAGCFAGSEAVGGPIVARFIDTYGQRRVLPPLALVHLLSVTALIIVVSRSAPIAIAVAVAICAGASAPQFGAFASVRWSRLLRGKPEIETAFSMEAVANDCAFIVGPTLAATLVAVLGPQGGVVVAGVLATTAAAVLSRLLSTEPTPKHTTAQARRKTPVYRNQPWLIVIGVCGLNVALGLTFGTTQLSMTALARSTDQVALAGILYTSMSVGSLVSSLSYGAIKWTIPIWLRLTLSASTTALGATVFVLVDAVPVYIVALFVMGIGIGPIIVMSTVVLERSVGANFLTQSFALAGATSAIGIALAGVSGGAVIDSFGFRGGMQFVLAVSLVNALIGIAMRGLMLRFSHRPGAEARTATESR